MAGDLIGVGWFGTRTVSLKKYPIS